MSRASLPYEKTAAHGSGSFAKGFLERREVEKGVLHKDRRITSFRRLCIFRIPGVFELPVTELKTKFDFFMNGKHQEKPVSP